MDGKNELGSLGKSVYDWAETLFLNPISGNVTLLLTVFLKGTGCTTERCFFFENASRERVLGVRARFKDFSAEGLTPAKRLKRRPVGVVPMRDL